MGQVAGYDKRPLIEAAFRFPAGPSFWDGFDRMSDIATADPLTALRGGLDDLESLITAMSSERYAVNPAPGFSSGVGPHVRHCLDHVESLMDGFERGNPIDYDARHRGAPEETDRQAGLDRLGRIRVRLDDLDCDPGRHCEIRVMVSPDEPARLVPSSRLREMLYVFQHTIHHLALMSAIARSLGVPLDDDIGRAPSTRADDRRRSCAR